MSKQGASPLRPDPYWTPERLETFREQHIQGIRSHPGTIPADLAEIQRRWFIKDSERSEYRRYQLDKHENEFKNRNNPDYKAWVAYAEAAWSDAKAPVPLSFKIWLKPKDDTTQFLITPVGVVTYSCPSTVNLYEVQQKLIELATQGVNLMDYQELLGITILKIDKKPEKPRIGFIDV